MEVGARKLGQLFCICGILVGNGDKADGRVLGGKPRALRADAARADDRDAKVFRLHVRLPKLCYVCR
jgi:hypothetical protein